MGGLIRKYLVSNYPNIDLGEDSKKYKKALELAEKNGQLERLTGKGYSGTFRLVDGASKLGNEFGDAFENALIAMNEPKQLSVSKLRDYLGVYHPEYNTDNRPDGLKKALDRAVAKGWLNQVSGKGFSGTYRLMHPYYPGPRELWGKDFVEAKAKDEDAPKKKRPRKLFPAGPLLVWKPGQRCRSLLWLNRRSKMQSFRPSSCARTARVSPLLQPSSP